ncbi:hypothetical protein KTN05_12125 [Paracoccus sp. Z118]|uniref:DUF6522 family protein n=1 Tax=Paracoccus sp. Z118 TaxID=2851017 RepID=UPI001C2CBC97|nr:DUF6522 family protein [Paracoccus sp. Z118]MBV0892597.1 hypothetical protein [Paracoccus sp. Z118]
MNAVSLRGGDAEIDAGVVAAAFGMTQEAFREEMQAGRIASQIERGEGEDAGRVRLTFYSETRRVRFTCDATGAVIATNTIDFAGRPLPSGLRKGG